MRAVLALLMILGVVAWVAMFIVTFHPESIAARVIDGAMLLCGIGALTLLSFLIWPRRA